VSAPELPRVTSIDVEHAEHVKAILFALLAAQKGWRARFEVSPLGMALVVEVKP
jgi:hypothetical protein